MKYRILMCITAMTLFAVLAVPVQTAAQEQTQRAGKFQQYVITDLGTLGGTFSQANGINNKGSVVGTASLTGDPLFTLSSGVRERWPTPASLGD